MNSNVPSVQQLNGDFSGGRPIFDPLTTRVNPANPSQFIRDSVPGQHHSGEPPVAAGLYLSSRWFPAPNNGPGLFVYSPALSLDTNKFDIKVSPRLTAKDSLVSRYSFVDNKEQDVQAYPALGYYPLHSRSQNAGLNYLHIFSPAVTGEVDLQLLSNLLPPVECERLQRQGCSAQAGITGYEGISNLQPAGPRINLSGYTALAGSTDNRPKANRIRTYQYRSSLTWAHGKHIMKFGAQLIPPGARLLPRQTSQGSALTSTASTRRTRSARETRATRSPISCSGTRKTNARSTPLQIYGNTGNFWSFYGQDDYRMTRNLTLNMGFRWELNSFLAGIRGQTNAFDFVTGKVIIPTATARPT